MFKPVEAVKCTKENGGSGRIESVADILERELQAVVVKCGFPESSTSQT
jgi:hypothetical protein